MASSLASQSLYLYIFWQKKGSVFIIQMKVTPPYTCIAKTIAAKKSYKVQDMSSLIFRFAQYSYGS